MKNDIKSDRFIKLLKMNKIKEATSFLFENINDLKKEIRSQEILNKYSIMSHDIRFRSDFATNERLHFGREHALAEILKSYTPLLVQAIKQNLLDENTIRKIKDNMLEYIVYIMTNNWNTKDVFSLLTLRHDERYQNKGEGFKKSLSENLDYLYRYYSAEINKKSYYSSNKKFNNDLIPILTSANHLYSFYNATKEEMPIFHIAYKKIDAIDLKDSSWVNIIKYASKNYPEDIYAYYIYNETQKDTTTNLRLLELIGEEQAKKIVTELKTRLSILGMYDNEDPERIQLIQFLAKEMNTDNIEIQEFNF